MCVAVILEVNHLFLFIEMAGEGVHDNPNLKGFARYFNSETNVGRANVSLKLMILSW